MSNFIYQDECFKIIGICMKIHRILWPGLLEKVYKEAMEYEFKLNNIPYEREKLFKVYYLEIILPSKFSADFVAYDRLILEIKAKNEINENDVAQTLNYLSICKSPLGLLINFGGKSLQHQRIIQSKYRIPK